MICWFSRVCQMMTHHQSWAQLWLYLLFSAGKKLGQIRTWIISAQPFVGLPEFKSTFWQRFCFKGINFLVNALSLKVVINLWWRQWRKTRKEFRTTIEHRVALTADKSLTYQFVFRRLKAKPYTKNIFIGSYELRAVSRRKTIKKNVIQSFLNNMSNWVSTLNLIVYFENMPNN